jgi:hypothetical protein
MKTRSLKFLAPGQRNLPDPEFLNEFCESNNELTDLLDQYFSILEMDYPELYDVSHNSKFSEEQQEEAIQRSVEDGKLAPLVNEIFSKVDGLLSKFSTLLSVLEDKKEYKKLKDAFYKLSHIYETPTSQSTKT